MYTQKAITDPDVVLLAQLATTIREDYDDEDDEWKSSPFAWVKTRPSRQIGAIGEKLISGWLAAKGFDVTRSPDSDADRIVNGLRAEIKFSTLWKNGGFKFQQIRNQDYDFILMLGICPFDAFCWAVPKSTVMEKWQSGDGIIAQHGGSTGVDTAWLGFPIDNPPRWLQSFGGSLKTLPSIITRITNRRPL